MTDLPRASRIAAAGTWSGAADRVVLDYDGRFLRRKLLIGEGGLSFLADLPQTRSLDAGDALVLDDGRCVEIAAADEPVYRVAGDLPRLAWHIGNRHTPCEIGAAALTIRQDHVLGEMLAGLGATVTEARAPFRPEGGAYGIGRTLGHDHGPGHGSVHHHASHHHLADEDEEAEEPGDPGTRA